MEGDHCTAQWSHKFVYVCMCFGGFLLFVFVIVYIKKYSACMLGETKFK